jgi:cystathionine gamma-synthase
MSTFSKDIHQDTLAARFAVDTDPAHGAVIPPLYMSSNFSFRGFGEKRGYDYALGNPRATSWRRRWRLEGGVAA